MRVGDHKRDPPGLGGVQTRENVRAMAAAVSYGPDRTAADWLVLPPGGEGGESKEQQ